MKLKQPLFIVFEGIDGSGKSTTVQSVYNHLKSRNLPAVMMKEPSDGKWGKKIRKMLKGNNIPDGEVQLELFLRDREEDVKKNIVPALEKKKIILMDRYYYSNAAYQGAMGIAPDIILKENKNRKFPEPDRVYLIDIEPDEALNRISTRSNSGREIFEKKILLEKIRDIYKSIADNKFCIIDGNGSRENVFKKIAMDIENNFGNK